VETRSSYHADEDVVMYFSCALDLAHYWAYFEETFFNWNSIALWATFCQTVSCL